MLGRAFRRRFFPNPALLTRNTKCLAGAYDRYDETALRPGFADQKLRYILSTARSAPFLRAVAVHIRRLSLLSPNSQLPIRPIGHISHGANPSLKIHLLPNDGTDRNVRSSEYLAAPAVDQCIVRQCSSFLLSSNCFSSRDQIAVKSRSKPNASHHVPSTEVAKRSSLTKSRLNRGFITL